MVTLKKLSFIFFLCPLFLFSAEFTATVNQTQVNVGNSLTLTLSLKGDTPKENPDVDPLKKAFIIHSQQQSIHTTVINGQVTSGTNWKLVLIPKSEGEIELPSITIGTSGGNLSTKPIMIRVMKGGDTPNFQDGLVLTSSVSEGDLYKNGTFVYTIQLSSTNDLASLKMENIEIKDAIVEVNEKPKIYEKIVNGIQTGVIEYRYYITPIKDGPLTLPSAIIQGGVLVKRKGARSLFDDDFDPFSMQRFSRIEPFALTTQEMTVSIQPSVADVDPWLPAKSLKIEEIWNESQTFRVGEPLSRSFKISAEGIHSSQLPSLSDLQSGAGLKIYADKPELGDDFQDSSIKSHRNEHYTIIPQQSGSIVLPKIEIAWWNTVEKKKMIVTIPEKRLEILPVPTQMTSTTQVPSPDQAANSNPPAKPAAMQSSSLNYALIGGLTFLLIISIAWGVFLHRKIGKMKAGYMSGSREGGSVKQIKSSHEKMQPQKKEKREKLIDLNPT